MVNWSIFTSLILHLGAWALVASTPSATSENVPIGVELRYGSPTRVAADSAFPSRKREAQRLPQRAKSKKAKVAGLRPENLQSPNQVTEQLVQSEQVGAENGAIVSALERYKYELRLFLESRKIYPETARRLHQSGVVVVSFKVGAEGELLDVMIERPSGSEFLNSAALDLIKRAEKFKPLPQVIKYSELTLSLPIEYIL